MAEGWIVSRGDERRECATYEQMREAVNEIGEAAWSAAGAPLDPAWPKATADEVGTWVQIDDTTRHVPLPQGEPIVVRAMSHTRTRAFTVTEFADPYKTCNNCGAWITGVTNEIPFRNYPCLHGGGYTDQCPSWGPIDGCSCIDHLGHVPHGEPSTPSKEATDE